LKYGSTVPWHALSACSSNSKNQYLHRHSLEFCRDHVGNIMPCRRSAMRAKCEIEVLRKQEVEAVTQNALGSIALVSCADAKATDLTQTGGACLLRHLQDKGL